MTHREAIPRVGCLAVMTAAQDRFEAALREQARVADARSARVSALWGHAEPLAAHNQAAADALRQFAHDFRRLMSASELADLECWSDGEMRTVAVTMCLLSEFAAIRDP